MAYLHLNLKGEYFDKIKSGEKIYEYRSAEKWLKRLHGKQFEGIILKHGYPKRGEDRKIIVRPWLGFSLETITHPHFGNDPVQVCAILVN